MTGIRLTMSAGALAMLSAAYAMAAPAYVASTVNLRSGPGTNNEIVGKIPGGSLVDASNCAEGWCEVAWQGKNGFAIATALDMSGRVPARSAAARRAPPRGYVEADDDEVIVSPPLYYGGPVYYPYYSYRPFGYYGYRSHWGYRGGWRRRW